MVCQVPQPGGGIFSKRHYFFLRTGTIENILIVNKENRSLFGSNVRKRSERSEREKCDSLAKKPERHGIHFILDFSTVCLGNPSTGSTYNRYDRHNAGSPYGFERWNDRLHSLRWLDSKF
jgi:hypothetical protein